jgi:hypothetical protein
MMMMMIIANVKTLGLVCEGIDRCTALINCAAQTRAAVSSLMLCCSLSRVYSQISQQFRLQGSFSDASSSSHIAFVFSSLPMKMLRMAITSFLLFLLKFLLLLIFIMSLMALILHELAIGAGSISRESE